MGKDKFEVLGQRLGATFVVKCHCDRGPATKRAASAMAALRRSDGAWLDVRAVDADGKLVRLYVYGDKNGRMVRLEREGEKLPRRAHRRRTWLFLLRDSLLSYKFKPVAELEASAEGPTLLVCNGKMQTPASIKQRSHGNSRPTCRSQRGRSIAFSNLVPDATGPSLKIPCWNCRALLHSDGGKRKKTIR